MNITTDEIMSVICMNIDIDTDDYSSIESDLMNIQKKQEEGNVKTTISDNVKTTLTRKEVEESMSRLQDYLWGIK